MKRFLALAALALSAASAPGSSAAMFIEVGSPTAYDSVIAPGSLTTVGVLSAGFEGRLEPGTPIKVAPIRLKGSSSLRFDPLVHPTRLSAVRFVHLGTTTSVPTTFLTRRSAKFDNETSSGGESLAPFHFREGPVPFGFLSLFPAVDEIDYLYNASGVTGDSGSVTLAATEPFELGEGSGHPIGTDATIIIWDPSGAGPTGRFGAMYVGMVRIDPVPVPASAPLLGFAMLMLVAGVRRARKARC